MAVVFPCGLADRRAPPMAASTVSGSCGSCVLRGRRARGEPWWSVRLLLWQWQRRTRQSAETAEAAIAASRGISIPISAAPAAWYGDYRHTAHADTARSVRWGTSARVNYELSGEHRGVRGRDKAAGADWGHVPHTVWAGRVSLVARSGGRERTDDSVLGAAAEIPAAASLRPTSACRHDLRAGVPRAGLALALLAPLALAGAVSGSHGSGVASDATHHRASIASPIAAPPSRP